jgi:hypothetical protein
MVHARMSAAACAGDPHDSPPSAGLVQRPPRSPPPSSVRAARCMRAWTQYADRSGPERWLTSSSRPSTGPRPAPSGGGPPLRPRRWAFRLGQQPQRARLARHYRDGSQGVDLRRKRRPRRERWPSLLASHDLDADRRGRREYVRATLARPEQLADDPIAAGPDRREWGCDRAAVEGDARPARSDDGTPIQPGGNVAPINRRAAAAEVNRSGRSPRRITERSEVSMLEIGHPRRA